MTTVGSDISPLSRYAFFALAGLCLVSTLLAFGLNLTFLLGIPAIVVLIAYTILDYKRIFYLLLFLLPCSIEYYFPSGLSTDLPTEPMMFGMALVTIGLLVYHRHSISALVFVHPLMAILLLHILWIFVSAVHSEQPVYSFKVFAAKLWYYLPFAVLPTLIIRGLSDIKRIFWCIYIPLTFLIIVSLLRHGILYQFGFTEVNKSVYPYFRNHVNYAAMVSIFFPMLLWARRWYPSGSNMRLLLNGSIILYIIAIYLSYTRTAMLAILAMIPFYIVMTRGWTMYLMAVGVILIGVWVGWLFYDNHYLKFAPDYETTIYHDDFGSHLGSTFEGKDVSAMERVYRWVAAARMSRDRPWMGVGPGNFYSFYQKYTVTDFETYVSANEERSTVHNYFLLILAEQGWLGLSVFLLLTIAIFATGQHAYSIYKHSTTGYAVVIIMLLMVSIYVNLLLSDMLESDKVGPFFFLFISLLAMIDRGVLVLEQPKE